MDYRDLVIKHHEEALVFAYGEGIIPAIRAFQYVEEAFPGWVATGPFKKENEIYFAPVEFRYRAAGEDLVVVGVFRYGERHPWPLVSLPELEVSRPRERWAVIEGFRELMDQDPSALFLVQGQPPLTLKVDIIFLKRCAGQMCAWIIL